MHQVLFEIPFLHIPIYGFGAMLFLAFIGCVTMASWRAEKEGVSKTYIHDVALWIFAAGIFGARVTYMIQYHLSLSQFFVIWRGGLVFYGSFVGGVIGYGLWRAWVEGRDVLRENYFKVMVWSAAGAALGAITLWVEPVVAPPNGLIFGLVAGAVAGLALAYILTIQKNAPLNWKLMDIIAPTIALGLAIGRIGCFLNGCCFGNVACPDCPAVHFPLSAPSRFVYVQAGYQTAAGFTTAPTNRDDPRTRVEAVDPHSAAAASGLKSGDRIVALKGEPNKIIVDVSGSGTSPRWWEFINYLQRKEREFVATQPGRVQVFYKDLDKYQTDLDTFDSADWRREISLGITDLFTDRLVYNWPHGETELSLSVVHPSETQAVALAAFTPRTLGLHPTQLYETISMLLLLLLLNAYFPFRRHDGEVMALFMLCYSVHRFLNEMLRNDTDPVFANMTLSQNGSILVFLTALALLIYLWSKPVHHQPTPAPAPA
jgi:prolipoprotein diacylglyceryltransferase